MAHKILHTILLATGVSVASMSVTTPAYAQSSAYGQQSWHQKLGSSIKSGTSKMAAAVTPKKNSNIPAPTGPPNGKAGPNVYVAAAQMHERAGNFDEAEASYRKALDMDQNHLNALVGFARLEDRRGNFEAATKFYMRAIKKHPRDASVHNDMGLCYHRRGKLPEASRELKKAVELAPDSKLYRNNLAAVYVEQGKEQEALTELVAAHGQAVAHYNLGYLLVQKKNDEAALKNFQMAAQLDPKLLAAQEWVNKLSAPANYAVQAGGPNAGLPQQYAPQPQQPAAIVAQRPDNSYYAPPATAPAPQQHPQYQPAPQAPTVSMPQYSR